MKDTLINLRNIFLYCGLSKEEYNSVKQKAFSSNLNLWKVLNVLMAGAYFIVAVLVYLSKGKVATSIPSIMCIYMLAISFCFLVVFDKASYTSQVIIYLTVFLIYLSVITLCMEVSFAFTTGFFVTLILLPCFLLGRPWIVSAFIALAFGAFLLTQQNLTESDWSTAELVYSFICSLIGIALHIYYNCIRMRGYVLTKASDDAAVEARATGEEMRQLNKTLRLMSESTVDLLGDVVESRDAESGSHVHRVKGFSYTLARQVMQDLPEYQLDDYTVDLIAATSVLHDVGKIAIPDAILCKPGKLTPEEFDIMKTHCEKGCVIINKLTNKWSRDYLDTGLAICYCHHEKWDGKGYPRGIKGDEIPISAQIVSIADIYDALTTKRVYKDAYSFETAYSMIINGECGAFSEKLLECFKKCRRKFETIAANPESFRFIGRDYELVSVSSPSESFVIGLHDQNRTLQEKARLSEEISVLESISDSFYYVCYVNMVNNSVKSFKADERFTRMLNSYGDMPSNLKFDKLLNSIIVSEDYPEFRTATHRETAVPEVLRTGRLFTDFRIRLDDGIHFCRMKIALNPYDKNAVIIAIIKRDEEHARETEYARVQQELETAKKEIEAREKLADRLAVIDSISGEYDYVCTLNAETWDVTVYRAVDWIQDMFKNLEDIVVSPEVRDAVLKGTIYPADFEQFKAASMHPAVMKGLSTKGEYCVNYRAYKYGSLVNYQTRYTLDANDHKRIIIGLRCLGPAEES